MRRTVAIILSTAMMLSACDVAPGGAVPAQPPAGEAALPQHLKIFVDGVPLQIDPDRPSDGQVATAHVVHGRLVITAQDKVTDHLLTVEAPFPGAPAAGELLSYLCKPVFGCEEPALETPRGGTMLAAAPRPHGPALPRLWAAHRAPKLGLQPLTVSLQLIRPVSWPGVGAAYRIKGTFRGTVADTVEDWSHPRINGPTRLVEGNFDMYAQKL